MPLDGKRFWTLWGKVKQVLSQLGIYFAGVSMVGIAMTAWHTTISPILVSYGITPSIWWLILGIGIPFLVLGAIEWTKGTPGFFKSFAQLFYTDDSPMKKDTKELKADIAKLQKSIDDLTSTIEDLKESK